MPNFSLRFAMRCTEQQWKRALVDGFPLSIKLTRLGYDLSLLQFYPNKPYVATYYKQTSEKISTTNTPFKDGREVVEEFNPELFYALCCQLDGDHVTAGEFITNNKNEVYQIHSLEGTWLRHNYPDGKNAAFAKASVHKSTFAELLAWFTGHDFPELGNFPSEEVEKAKRKPGRPARDQESPVTTAEKIEAAQKIVSSKKGLTIEEMIDVSKQASPDSAETFIYQDPAIENYTVKESQILDFVNDFEPLGFKQLLNWYADHNSVVWGFVEGGEIHSEIRGVSHISKENVLLDGDKEPTGFTQIFRNQQHFLNFALTKI